MWRQVLGAAICFGLCPVGQTAPAPANGIAWPPDYKTWQIIGVSHRDDKASLRTILGNPTAIQALKAGQTRPWPDGTILAKIAWQDGRHPLWQAAIVPKELSHIEFMIKDSQQYRASGGWGFARWVGMQLEPLNDGGGPCFECHKAAAQSDYVFTQPAPVP